MSGLAKIAPVVARPKVSSRIVLRRPRACDCAGIVATYGDRDVGRMFGSIALDYDTTNAEAFVSRVQNIPDGDQECVLAITSGNGRFIGSIRMGPRAGRLCLSYGLMQSMWGCGIMSNVVPRFIAHYFQRRRVAPIFADYFAINVASGRVLEKAGFEKVAEEDVWSRYNNANMREILMRLREDRVRALCASSTSHSRVSIIDKTAK